jgi:hypothetical protein
MLLTHCYDQRFPVRAEPNIIEETSLNQWIKFAAQKHAKCQIPSPTIGNETNPKRALALPHLIIFRNGVLWRFRAYQFR